MDFATLIGVVGAFLLMGMAIMSGGPLMLFVNPPSIIIVMGGTIGATLVHYPFRDVLRTLSIASKAFFFKQQTAQDTIKQAFIYSNKARKEGLLALEDEIKDMDDQFFAKGLMLAIDGYEKEQVDASLQLDVDYTGERHEYGAQIFEAIGAYAPAMGMIGTLIGLVQMLQSLEDPTTIGPAMAVALLTTFYGAVIANVICIPIAGKLKARARDEALRKALIVEAVLSIVDGENPKIMQGKLLAFLPPKLRKEAEVK